MGKRDPVIERDTGGLWEKRSIEGMRTDSQTVDPVPI